ncbi:DUF4376 domain-containing protein [Citrobacter braakii]|uniref:DUF4376 domain-containing protein n=1 Tax=Citrobacter TaxID=544 RepID=UPI0010C9ECA4|nr:MULTISPECIES: DUF4376 domain-containing protein [unclassified Citrobacter]TKU63911.1 DUF4376 domain-containing protein [Citrobacter sp. wls713]TKU98788.1 DUF4376 domain-containing protein [Citrobacter sp. wls621]
MKIIDIKAMKYLEDGSVSCEVMFEGGAGYIPYRAVEHDSAATGRTVWISLMSGEFGEISPFTVTPEMLATAREVKKQEINAWRDRLENSSVIFEFNGHAWDGGKASQSRLSPVIVAAQAGTLPPGFFWTDADNHDVELTTEQLIQLAGAMTQAMVAEGFRIHERQRQMKEEVAALDTLKAIRSYPVGWPEVGSE